MELGCLCSLIYDKDRLLVVIWARMLVILVRCMY